MFDGALGDGERTLAFLQSTHSGNVAGRARENRGSFRLCLEASQDAGAEVRQNLLE